MSCAGSERAENNKGFDCSRNMGEVLGKECAKDDSTFAHSSENSLKDIGESAASSGAVSESESDKDVSNESDEDISWLLSFNTDELSPNKCKCEGCLRRNESYNSEKKNAKLLLSSWKEFQSHIRSVYMKPTIQSSQKGEAAALEENERLHEMVQVMRLCDPYQLFQKIEGEVKAIVLRCRMRLLVLLRDASNPLLAQQFIAGLIQEYVKLLSSALQLLPAIETLLGPQLQRFGLTWNLLNKHLYQSLVYTNYDVQENLSRFVDELTAFPPDDEVYYDIVYQYLVFEDEMTGVREAWEKVEPIIEEYKNSKAKEMETLNNLRDALKAFFSNKVNTVNGNGSIDGRAVGDEVSQYCPSCMTRRGCPCDECTVTHIMSCEGLESPSPIESPGSRSRSPVRDKETPEKDGTILGGQEQQLCECHACTVPPPDLMDCSVTFNQLSGKNTHGEGFQLYPHIHGTVADNLYDSDNIQNIYGNLQASQDAVYPHLYNLYSQSNSIPIAHSQLNASGVNHNQNQTIQTPTIAGSPPHTQSTAATTKLQSQEPPPPSPLLTTAESAPLSKCAPSLPPPPPSTSQDESVVMVKSRVDQATKSTSSEKPPTTASAPADLAPAAKKCLNPKSNAVEAAKSSDVKAKKLTKPGATPTTSKESDVTAKSSATTSAATASDKPRVVPNYHNVKGMPCVKAGFCGKCCLRHGLNCVKSPGCGVYPDKSLSGASRCPTGKEPEHTHKPGKGHSCGKLKPHDAKKKPSGKMLEHQDDSSSQDDTCSERSNSTTTSTQKDSRHCDCCYCEVFGHGVPSVAPVSRNFQEMRERLRIRLNMKKSAKCKADQANGVAQSNNKTAAHDEAKKTMNDMDLESLLKYIEGKTQAECKDPKRVAKKARQKQKKLEERERLEEDEADRKRLEAMKKQVTVSVVNENSKKSQSTKQNQQQSGKQQQIQQQQSNKNASNNSKQQNNQNNNRNNSSSNSGSSSNKDQGRNSQNLNLSGLKSLVEKSDPNSGPKMVTIRRVMAPFSAEPTVTITLKGSTPDKDKVLFMLKNGSETFQPEEKESTKKKRKRKKSKKEPVEYYNEDENEEEEEPEQYYEEEEVEDYEEEEQEETFVQGKKRRRRKNKNKNAAEVETNSKSSSGKNSSDGKSSKSGGASNSRSQSTNNNNINNSKKKVSTTSSPSPVTKIGSSTQPATTKGNQQKSVPVLKAQNQNLKIKDVNSSQASKSVSNAKSSSNSVNNSKDGNSNNSSAAKGGGARNSSNSTSGKGGNAQKQSSTSGQKSASQSGKQANGKENIQQQQQAMKQGQKGKEAKGKATAATVAATQKGKNSAEKTKQTAAKTQESQRKSKAQQKPATESHDLGVRFPSVGAGYDRGKVVINTPSYRLSEVLSSIAPSPPPKEEINLENLRLPPGITITKIEGPITKSIRASEQPVHLSKPVPMSSPIVVSTPTLKQVHQPPPPGNVIVVDTGRLKEVIKENTPSPASQTAMTATTSKRKKKKNKQSADAALPPTVDVPQTKFALKPTNPLLGKTGVTVISADEARKMVPNLENQQATIIKTSDNMVTIRSPAFQQAMNMHACASGNPAAAFRPGINGYNNVSLFREDMNRITDSIGKLKMSNAEEKLARQMRNLNIKEGSRAGQLFAQAMAAAGQNSHLQQQQQQEQQKATGKKSRKKKKKHGRSDEKEVEPVESVFQPKDIDLENGDIDDDERELEAFKRFCLQSVPSERKNKVKVNLNIKDIVLKKKSSAVGCN